MGEVLSRLAREALTSTAGADVADEEFFGFEPFSARGGTVTNALVDQLRADEQI